jgi:hypothetical protein
LGPSAGAAASANPAQDVAAKVPDWAPGRLLLMPRAGLPPEGLADVVRPFHGRLRPLGPAGVHIVELPPQASETATLARLRGDPHLKSSSSTGWWPAASC